MPRGGWPDCQQPIDRGLMSLLEQQRSAVVGPLTVHFGLDTAGRLVLCSPLQHIGRKNHQMQQTNHIECFYTEQREDVASLSCHVVYCPAEGASSKILQMLELITAKKPTNPSEEIPYFPVHH